MFCGFNLPKTKIKLKVKLLSYVIFTDQGSCGSSQELSLGLTGPVAQHSTHQRDDLQTKGLEWESHNRL